MMPLSPIEQQIKSEMDHRAGRHDYPNRCPRECLVIESPADALRRVVFTAIGAASTLWDPMDGTGVFMDAEARKLGDAVVAFVDDAIANAIRDAGDVIPANLDPYEVRAALALHGATYRSRHAEPPTAVDPLEDNPLDMDLDEREGGDA